MNTRPYMILAASLVLAAAMIVCGLLIRSGLRAGLKQTREKEAAAIAIRVTGPQFELMPGPNAPETVLTNDFALWEISDRRSTPEAIPALELRIPPEPAFASGFVLSETPDQWLSFEAVPYRLPPDDYYWLLRRPDQDLIDDRPAPGR